MLFPSGVSSSHDDRRAASPTSLSVWFPRGMNLIAFLIPFVIVPVLSSRRASVSPAASIAFPDFAIILLTDILFMPDMPIAGRSAPIVVGRRQTYSAITTARSIPSLSSTPRKRRATIIIVNIAENPAIRMVRAISFGVFGLEDDSTRLISLLT